MGLNPEVYHSRVLDEEFNSGSPYMGMYRAGLAGVPLQDIVEKCRRNGIALRKKDIVNYNNGCFSRTMNDMAKTTGFSKEELEVGISFEKMKLADFPMLPIGWKATEKRFFPCTSDNKPMQKWGWSRDYTPELYSLADARALSPCGWVGQNLLYQDFVVLDIDGRGHGCDDEEVIEFGNQFRDKTMVLEDPSKPGSFHLYFKTDRLIPTKHFPWSKLDFVGNALNSAVYLKNKKWNGIPMARFEEETWRKMMEYQQKRKR